MQKRFVRYTILFFIPVILIYGITEYLTRKLPMEYKTIGTYLEKNSNKIELLILGSSQMKNAVNPEYLSKTTLNMASGNQHHDTDFKIIKQLLPRLKNLKTIVLEVSYSHFELPHNGKDFWKNRIYWEYYHINNFERPAWFKDRLIFLAHPPFFSEKIVNHYYYKKTKTGFNPFGFDTLNFDGDFKKFNYNLELIKKDRFKINLKPDKNLFKQNTHLFFKILDYLQNKNLQVIVVTAPMFKTYLPERVPEILYRRDSILDLVSKKYSNVNVFKKEEDTTHYSVFDYKNQSHLNPKGAKIYTKQLDSVLKGL